MGAHMTDDTTSSNTGGVVGGVLSDYMDETTLAAELNQSPRTLQRWRRACTGPPFVEIGRTIFYKRSRVADWLDQREVRPREKKRRAA
jgi:hypothetical protein